MPSATHHTPLPGNAGFVQTEPNETFSVVNGALCSADGKTLYLLSVEKGFFKRGLSYPECAEILLALGADDAIEFDGGSSTSLFMDGMIDISESPRKNAAYMGLTF